jgi:hypothetical protein
MIKSSNFSKKLRKTVWLHLSQRLKSCFGSTFLKGGKSRAKKWLKIWLNLSQRLFWHNLSQRLKRWKGAFKNKN